jgi:hypothetical protein
VSRNSTKWDPVATKTSSEAEAKVKVKVKVKAARLVLLRVGILRVEVMASVLIGCYKAEGRMISQHLYFQQESNCEKHNTTNNVESQSTPLKIGSADGTVHS